MYPSNEPMRSFWLKIVGIVFCIGLFNDNQVLGQIKSKSYKTLLNTLYKKEVPLVSCDQAEKASGAVFLDTRARPEYEVSHIKGAEWVGYDDFTLDRVRHLPKSTPIVVYCSVGVRSERIGKQLLDAGYQRVYNLYGSLFEWVNQGKPVVDASGQPTQKVHAYSKTWGIWLQKGEKVYD